MYLIGGSLLLLISLFFLFQKKSKKSKIEKVNIPAYQEAIDKFTHLDEKALLENNKIKEYYIELTEIIRVYLGKEVNVHTLEATTDELIDLINMQNSSNNIGISKESIVQLKAFLQHADFVKFAKLRPSSTEIQNDRNIAATLVQNMKPLLDKYKAEQKELKAAMEIAEKPKTEFSFKKLSKRSKIILGIIVFAIFVVSFFGYQIYETAQITKGANTLSNENSGSVSDGWSVQKFGSPALVLTAPGTIALKSDEVPVQAQSVISELNIYSYLNSSQDSEISITSLVYSEQINPDIEQVIQGTIGNLEKTLKIDDLEFERQPASFGEEISGVFLKGSYTEKGKKKGFNLLGFSQENKVWQVLTMANFDDLDEQTTMDTVIQSIKFETK